MGRKKSDTPTQSVRLHAWIVRMANVIAAHEGKAASDVLSELIEGPLKKRYAEALKKLQREHEEGGK